MVGNEEILGARGRQVATLVLFVDLFGCGVGYLNADVRVAECAQRQPESLA